MKTNLTNKILKLKSTLGIVSVLVVAATLVTGCGSRMSGTYTGNTAPFKEMKFISGNKVELTMISGPVMEATYTVESDKLKLSMGGQTLIYTITKDGCLDGGAGIMGMENKLCKK